MLRIQPVPLHILGMHYIAEVCPYPNIFLLIGFSYPFTVNCRYNWTVSHLGLLL